MVCIWTLVAELLLAFILKSVFSIQVTNTDAFVFILVFSLSYFITLYSTHKLVKFRQVLLIGYLLRVFLLIWDIYGRSIYSLPSSGGDTERFFNAAINYAAGNEHWNNIAVNVFGTMIKLFGNSRLLIQFLLMLISIASAHITVDIMRMLKISEHSSKKAMIFMSVIPMYAVLSSIFLRESIITFFVSMSLYFFMKWWSGGRERYFLFAIAGSLLGAVFHSGIIGISIGYVCVRVIYDRKNQAFNLKPSSIILSGFFVVLFVFLYTRYSTVFFGKMGRIDELSDIASGYGRGGSSYASIAGNSSNVFNFIVFTPIRMFLFLFTPLLFQIRGLSDIIAMVFSAFFYLWIYYRAIKSIRRSEKRNKNLMIALLVVALVIAFIFGWGGTNIGTQVRHRDKIMPVYILLLALTFEPKCNVIQQGK